MAKQYTSIIRLFEHCGIDTGMEFNLPRAKKQLQAEFGISTNGFIETGGFSYTKHDVFEELDHPEFFKRFYYHRQLWKKKLVLQWLETNMVDLESVRMEFMSLRTEKEFDEFFSPWFTGPFVYHLRNSLAINNLKEVGSLLRYEDVIQPEDREEAFRPLRVYMDENFRLLRNVNGDNYKIMRPKIAHWINKDWYAFFNALPPEFYETKIEIATQLVNIGVAVQKTFRPDCRQVSEQLISLSDMPEHLRQTIVSNHAVYSNKSRSSKWGGSFWWGWLVIILVKVGLSKGCDDNQVQYNFREKPFIQTSPYFSTDSLASPLNDSYFKKLKDSTGKKLIVPKIKRVDTSNQGYRISDSF